MSPARLPFLDWMKCLGIGLIVFGHVTSWADGLVPPIYAKQLGVAFFLFAAGFSLARETRRPARVVYNRLFEVFLFGTVLAALTSALSVAQGGPTGLTNFLPFLLGANVAFDHFPANPTTWFVGTYTHLLLLWAVVLRRVRVRPWMLAVSVALEVTARAALAETCGLFVAYMALSNWVTVFLFGVYRGQAVEEPAKGGAVPWLLASAAVVVAWPLAFGSLAADTTFPLMRFRVGGRALDAAVTSASVSLVYLVFTALAYQVTRRLGGSAAIEFLARNTVIVFLAHMPVMFATLAPVDAWVGPSWARVSIRFFVCFFALAALSEVVRRAARTERLRHKVWSACTRALAVPASEAPRRTSAPEFAHAAPLAGPSTPGPRLSQ